MSINHMRNRDQNKGSFGRKLRATRRRIRFHRRSLLQNTRNRLRLRRNPELGYVIYPLKGSLPERAEPPRSFIQRQLPIPPPAQSLELINHHFDRIGAASNVNGVVLLLKDVSGSLARLSNLRAAIHRLKSQGKKVVVYSPTYSLAHYYVACAADKIVAPPSAEFSVMGLFAESFYLKDTLDEIGVQATTVRISPYKAGGNQLSESTMTEQEREQISWMLDEQYDLLTSAIAADRNMTQDAVKAVIDDAPFSVSRAVDVGMLDAVAYDDQLANLIAQWDGIKPKGEDEPLAKAPLTTFGNAWKKMPHRLRRSHDKYIGVVQITGPIMMNDAGSIIPFVSGPDVASETALTPILRHAEKDDEMAALLVYVNSPGGGALASDLIWRQIDRIGKEKPVLVYMGDVAASGGYYISACARHIMAQQATVTGSIGVFSQLLSLTELYNKLKIGRVALKRGENAGLYREAKVLSENDRAILWERLMDIYNQFKRVVADGRGLDFETLDPICEGRVWTGRQAQKLGLVDSFGDFTAAVEQLKSLADLPADERIDVPVRNLFGDSSNYVVPPAEAFAPPDTDPQSLLGTVLQLVNTASLKELSGQPLYMMPHTIRFY